MFGKSRILLDEECNSAVWGSFDVVESVGRRRGEVLEIFLIMRRVEHRWGSRCGIVGPGSMSDRYRSKEVGWNDGEWVILPWSPLPQHREKDVGVLTRTSRPFDTIDIDSEYLVANGSEGRTSHTILDHPSESE